MDKNQVKKKEFILTRAHGIIHVDEYVEKNKSKPDWDGLSTFAHEYRQQKKQYEYPKVDDKGNER